MAEPDIGQVPDFMEVDRDTDNESDDESDNDPIPDPQVEALRNYIFGPNEPDDPEVRLSRFLYVGKEVPEYQPGYWFVHYYFIVNNVPSIEELAAIPEKELVPVQLIVKAFESNLVPHPETLPFALAVCCRQTISEKLRHAAYKSVEKICATTEQFILFIRFVSKLQRGKELCYSTFGWGKGMKNAVNNWYMSKDSLALAKCVTKYRGRYGWKHKDIIKLCHIAGNTPEKALIMKYIVKGVQKAHEFASQESNDSVTKIMKYIEEIEKFKHCEEDALAAVLIQDLELSLEHVPGHFLKSKKIWMALLSLMDVTTLLKNLYRMHNLSLLKPNLGLGRVVELLCNEERLTREQIHPVQIVIALVNYQNNGKPLTYEKQRVRNAAKKPYVPPEPNQEVINALTTALYASFSHLQPTNLRYLITISLSAKTIQGHAWQCSNMTGFEVGCFLAMTLVRQESDVTVATYKNNAINVTDVSDKETYEEVIRKLRVISSGYLRLEESLLWALKMKKEYDVFINVVDQIHDKYDRSQEYLPEYRDAMNLPETKLINCAVCSCVTYGGLRRKFEKNVLVINGFDATVPILIQAFVKSSFE